MLQGLGPIKIWNLCLSILEEDLRFMDTMILQTVEILEDLKQLLKENEADA